MYHCSQCRLAHPVSKPCPASQPFSFSPTSTAGSSSSVSGQTPSSCSSSEQPASSLEALPVVSVLHRSMSSGMRGLKLSPTQHSDDNESVSSSRGSGSGSEAAPTTPHSMLAATAPSTPTSPTPSTSGEAMEVDGTESSSSSSNSSTSSTPPPPSAQQLSSASSCPAVLALNNSPLSLAPPVQPRAETLPLPSPLLLLPAAAASSAPDCRSIDEPRCADEVAHTASGNFPCRQQQCNKSYKQRPSLSRHRAVVHKGVRWVCGFCSERVEAFKDPRSFRQHYRTRHPLELSAGGRTIHEVERAARTKIQFRCQVRGACTFISVQYDQLQTHYRQQHRQQKLPRESRCMEIIASPAALPSVVRPVNVLSSRPQAITATTAIAAQVLTSASVTSPPGRLPSFSPVASPPTLVPPCQPNYGADSMVPMHVDCHCPERKERVLTLAIAGTEWASNRPGMTLLLQILGEVDRHLHLRRRAALRQHEIDLSLSYEELSAQQNVLGLHDHSLLLPATITCSISGARPTVIGSALQFTMSYTRCPLEAPVGQQQSPVTIASDDQRVAGAHSAAGGTTSSLANLTSQSSVVLGGAAAAVSTMQQQHSGRQSSTAVTTAAAADAGAYKLAEALCVEDSSDIMPEQRGEDDYLIQQLEGIAISADSPRALSVPVCDTEEGGATLASSSGPALSLPPSPSHGACASLTKLRLSPPSSSSPVPSCPSLPTETDEPERSEGRSDSPAVEEGATCDGDGCLLQWTPEWRFHCVTCAAASVNFNLCRPCFLRRSQALSAPMPELQSRIVHDATHEFTPIYNKHVSPSQLDEETRHLQSSLPELSSFSYSAAADAPSVLCRPLVRLLYLVGTMINNIGGTVALHQWMDMQWKLVPNYIDLSLFYHHNDEHEYLLLLYWSRSNILHNGVKLGQEFLDASQLDRLKEHAESNPSAHALLRHIRLKIREKTGGDIDVTRFDFPFVKRLLTSLTCLCEFFDKPEFTTVFHAITDGRHLYHRHFRQLNAYVMQMIDRQPIKMQDRLFSALVPIGLPSTATKLEWDNLHLGWGIVRYLQELYIISLEYERVCSLRACRLRLAELCYQLLREALMIPSEPSSPQWHDRLSVLRSFSLRSGEEQELLLFLQGAHAELRPRELDSVFEHDEDVILDVLNEGRGCMYRLEQLVEALVRTEAAIRLSASSSPQPSTANTSSSTRLSPPLSALSASCTSTPPFASLLRHLLSVFIFVSREYNQDALEAQLSRLQSPEQRLVLAGVITAKERWRVGVPHQGELVEVLGGNVDLLAVLRNIVSNDDLMDARHPTTHRRSDALYFRARRLLLSSEERREDGQQQQQIDAQAATSARMHTAWRKQLMEAHRVLARVHVEGETDGALSAQLARLAQQIPRTELMEGANVLVIGTQKAGKSTLIHSLKAQQVANWNAGVTLSDIAVVPYACSEFILWDCPGSSDGSSYFHPEMVSLYKSVSRVLLVVQGGSLGKMEPVLHLLDALRLHYIIVISKMDVVEARERDAYRAAVRKEISWCRGADGVFFVSAARKSLEWNDLVACLSKQAASVNSQRAEASCI